MSERNEMKRKIIISLTFLFANFLSPNTLVKAEDLIKSKAPEDIFNRGLEKLGESIRKNDSINTCQHSSNLLSILKTNKEHLDYLEPYYDWDAIKAVVLKFKTENCIDNKQERITSYKL